MLRLLPPMAALALAAAAATHAVIHLSMDADARAVSAMAARIAAGETFGRLAMERALAGLGDAAGLCAGRTPRDVLIVRAGALDAALGTSDLPARDAAAEALDTAARRAIACGPNDGFAWLALFWVALQRTGPDEAAIQALRRSFETAPYEAWIAFRRARLILTRSRALPADLVERALDDVVRLAEARFSREVAGIYADIGDPARQRLLRRFATLRRDIRADLASRLRERGIEELGEGGEDLPPWRRRN